MLLNLYIRHSNTVMGQNSTASTATLYGLDSLGLESLWRRDILHLSRPALRFTQSPIQWMPGHSWG